MSLCRSKNFEAQREKRNHDEAVLGKNCKMKQLFKKLCQNNKCFLEIISPLSIATSMKHSPPHNFFAVSYFTLCHIAKKGEEIAKKVAKTEGASN